MRYLRRLILLAFSGFALGIAALMGLYLYFQAELPDVKSLKTIQLQTPLKVFTADDQLVSQYGEKRRIPLHIEEIPSLMKQAFLAIEDARFYQHPGIDPIGIVRAAINLVVTGQKRQGASTITQQVARNFFLTRERTFTRKIKEVFLAWHIEQNLSKDEILNLYLNKIPLGHRSFGVGAAAQVYYGKSVEQLTLAQIAVIAGLPKAPSTLNPIRSPERSRARRNLVLQRMLDLGNITQQQFDEARLAPTTAKLHGADIDLNAPYLGEMVRSYMVSEFGLEDAYSKGYHVYTTVPSKLQLAAQQAMTDNLYAYDFRHGYRGIEEQLWLPLAPPEDEFSEQASITEMADVTEAPLPQEDPQSLEESSLTLIDAADNDPRWPDEKIIEHLAQYKVIKDLQPAVVLELREQTATVMLKDGSQDIIPWSGLSWARAFINDEQQGPVPMTAADIFTPGALILVRQTPKGLSLAQRPEVSGAFVAIDPINGGIKAIVGGFDFAQSQYNRVTQAKRQPGSNIKPFIYSYALEQGYTLASLINDAPINQWDKSQGMAWRPKNSPPVYDGPTRLRLGLSKSKNVMSVKLLRKVGLEGTRQHLNQFGFSLDDLPIGDSLALGSASMTPLSVVTGFAAFANGGYKVVPHFIDRIEDPQGNIVFQQQPVVACRDCSAQDGSDLIVNEFDEKCWLPEERLATQIISEQNAFLISEMLRSAIWGGGNWSRKTGWNGTGFRAQVLKRRDIGGKTGTTNDAKDAWFSGIHPHLVATSWIGFDNPSRVLGRTRTNRHLPKNQITGKEFGAKSAQPAWISFMKVALDGIEEQSRILPEGIKTVRIDRSTGLLSTKTDSSSRFEYFITGTEPTQYVDLAELPDDVLSEVNDDTEEIF